MADMAAIGAWTRRTVVKVFTGLAAIVFFAVLVIVYNGLDWIQNGRSLVPILEGKWWGGRYDTKLFGQQWCLVRFVGRKGDNFRMVMISPWGKPNIFEGERDSNDENFVYLTFTDNSVKPPLVIEAKQLYAGARYYVGPLFAGEFGRIGKLNDSVAIRGAIELSTGLKFEIEPVADDDLDWFWRTYVRPDNPSPSPDEMLKATGLSG